MKSCGIIMSVSSVRQVSHKQAAVAGAAQQRIRSLGKCSAASGVTARVIRRETPAFESRPLKVWAGQPDVAIEHLETSRRLNPRARVGGLSANIGIAHFCSRRFDQALPMLLLSVHDDPSRAGRYRFLAACYAHMGRLDEARETLDRIRVVTAVVMPPVDSFLRNAEHRELFLSGLGS